MNDVDELSDQQVISRLSTLINESITAICEIVDDLGIEHIRNQLKAIIRDQPE